MNDISGGHEPTPEFHQRLKINIARAYRSDQLFGEPANSAGARTPTRRFAMVFGVAAGVVLTLAAGMILGASASYAAAATPSTPRSAFAILPIKDALNALGCTQTPPIVNKAPRVAAAAAPTPGTGPDSAAMPARVDPDRAMIAALARQHFPAVVSGDTAAEFIVMVLDAAEKHVWSTYGSGNLSIQVGADPRTAEERVEYMREHRAEYVGAADATDADRFAFRRKMVLDGRGGVIDSTVGALHKRLTFVRIPDSTLAYHRLFDSLAIGAARGGGGRGGARGGSGGGDSLVAALYARRLKAAILPESLHFAGREGSFAGRGAGSAGGRGGGALNGVSTTNAPDGSYKIGWASSRAASSNDAYGLEASGSMQSGIQGVASTSLSKGESYVFPAGDLAPQTLRIVVVHLTPGTAWKGR